jgi:hypothetical protein
MTEEMRGRLVGGEGKTAEVDGGYFGGYVKPANLKEDRIDRRLASNQTGKRKVVVIIRERGGNSVPAVFGSESLAASFIRARIAKGTVVNADESGAWDDLHERFERSVSTIKRLTLWTAPAPIRQRNMSAACAAPKSVSTITLPAPICSATRKRVHGVRIPGDDPRGLRTGHAQPGYYHRYTEDNGTSATCCRRSVTAPR